VAGLLLVSLTCCFEQELDSHVAGIWAYYLWQFLEIFQGDSPLLASAKLVPLIISGALAAICTGMLLSRIRPAWIMVISMVCFLVGNILVATCPIDQTYWAQIFVCTIIIPWGMDMSFPAGTIILSNSVSKEHQGIAASLVNTVVNYSISIGLGFAGTVEVHQNNGGKTTNDKLLGLRSAYYMSIGLAGLGVVLSTMYLAKGYWKDRKAGKA
jgi:MFS family permease